MYAGHVYKKQRAWPGKQVLWKAFIMDKKLTVRTYCNAVAKKILEYKANMSMIVI